MTDAFAHLDLSVPDPLLDLRRRLDSAGLERALVVETWSGDNYQFLESLLSQACPHLRLAFCFRPGAESTIADWLRHPSVAALRVKTADLNQVKRWVAALESAGKVLLVHAESGIGALASPLRELAAEHPALRVYLPHLAWPREGGRDDDAWGEALELLRGLPNVIAGISALAYFSTAPYPHDDLRPLARRFLRTFPSSSVVLGSDYPLFDKERYADYVVLGRAWIESVYPDWSETDVLFS